MKPETRASLLAKLPDLPPEITDDDLAAEADAAMAASVKSFEKVEAFSRSAGIDPAALLADPAAAAQAFSRELADAKAAASALPKPLDKEIAGDRRRELSREISRLNAEKGFPKAFTDGLLNVLCGTAERPNVVMLGRDDGADAFRGLAVVELLAKHGPPPPSGQWAAGREAPRQSPEGTGAGDPVADAVAKAAKDATDARYKGTAAALAPK